MEDDLKKIMQPKTIKNKRVVAPLRVTLFDIQFQSCLLQQPMILYNKGPGLHSPEEVQAATFISILLPEQITTSFMFKYNMQIVSWLDNLFMTLIQIVTTMKEKTF